MIRQKVVQSPGKLHTEQRKTAVQIPVGCVSPNSPNQKDLCSRIQNKNIEFNPIGKNAICGTGDSFVEDSSNHHGEVVDMEAYALAKVCYLYNVPFISFKYITDGADGNAVVDWEENVGKGIVKFKEKVLDKLPKSL